MPERPGLIAELVDLEHENALAAFDHLSAEVNRLDRLLTILRDLISEGGGVDTSRQASNVLALLTYAFYFVSSAARRAMSGESYIVPLLIRAAIECAVYAAHIAGSTEAHDAWYQRHTDFAREAEAAAQEGREPDIKILLEGDALGRKKSRDAFGRRAWQASLEALLEGADLGPETVQILTKWYDLTIDVGAHPNVLMTVLTTEESTNPTSGAKVRMHLHFVDNPAAIASDLDNTFTVCWAITRVAAALVLEETGAADTMQQLKVLWLESMTPPPSS